MKSNAFSVLHQKKKIPSASITAKFGNRLTREFMPTGTPLMEREIWPQVSMIQSPLAWESWRITANTFEAEDDLFLRLLKKNFVHGIHSDDDTYKPSFVNCLNQAYLMVLGIPSTLPKACGGFPCCESADSNQHNNPHSGFPSVK